MTNRERADNQMTGDKKYVNLAHGGPFRFGPKTVRFELRTDCFGMMTG